MANEEQEKKELEEEGLEEKEGNETQGEPSAQPELEETNPVFPEPQEDKTEPQPEPPAPNVDEAEPEPQVEEAPRTFTQEEVDRFVGDARKKARERTMQYVFERYGVSDQEELDSLVANAQRYETLKERGDEDSARIGELSEELALMKSGIDQSRYEDAKLILKGKGMEVTEENISEMLQTHPEWRRSGADTPEEGNPALANAPEVVIQKPKAKIEIPESLGNSKGEAPQPSEEEEAKKIFRMKW